VGVFGAVEKPYVLSFSAPPYFGFPFSMLLAPANTLEARRVVCRYAHISLIFCGRTSPEVSSAVIQTIMIDMVNLLA
jgi:hypothetical protein